MPHTIRANGRRRAVEAFQDVGQGIVTRQGVRRCGAKKKGVFE